MGKIYNEFVGLYPLSKTIKNSIKPEGKTLEWILKNGVLETDNRRAIEYKKLKEFCDIEHKQFIEKVLKEIKLPNLERLMELYNIANKDENEKKEYEELKINIRKFISEKFSKNPEYKELFGKEMIKDKLAKRFENDEEALKIIGNFSRFTTYLSGFNENRRNIYSKEESNTAIAYRIIDENFPKFIENGKIYDKLKAGPLEEMLRTIEEEFREILGEQSLDDIFKLDGFNNVLSQSGIANYNEVIGGITKSNQEKLKGINEYINEHNQVCDKRDRIPKLKVLFKQILSDRETKSFIPETLENDKEALKILKELNNHIIENILIRKNGIGIKDLFESIEEYDTDKIYIRNDRTLTDISQQIFGDWNVINQGLETNYDMENGKLNTEKYKKAKEKYFKNIDSFSIKEINKGLKAIGKEQGIEELFKEFKKKDGENKKDYIEDINEKYNTLKPLLEEQKAVHQKGLPSDIKNKELIKNYLDACKDLQRFIKLCLGSGEEPEKDEKFYSELENIWLELDKLTTVYNKIRNYLTKKPYSTEKIKLNFNNPKLLEGWSKNKEVANSCLLFKDENYYYLGIINNEYNKEFKEYKVPENKEDIFEKMVYLQAADPAKDVQNFMRINGKVEKKNGRKDNDGVNRTLENLKNIHLPEEINKIRKERTFSRENMEKFNQKDLIKFIDFYKEMSIEYYSDYEFKFKDSKEYYSFKEFTDHINKQAYQIRFEKVSKKYIDSLVEEGKLYLFKIYNKDFSPHSKGTKNLHTLYFQKLFDEKNLENVVYKLNGQAEIFFREKSLNLEKTTIHYANQPIENKVKKDEQGNVTTATYKYDIIKDKRYTVDSFQLHIPITLNFSAEELKNINERVNKAIKRESDVHIIGIDRGERNLIYATVINQNGDIVNQESFNIIKNSANDKCGKDYHEDIKNKEKDRAKARLNWDNIEGIKQIKEGYLSQVIHKICLMMEEYNAIVVLEDLNFGFKNSRRKFETNVYQKFEKMLIEKLNYYVNKKSLDEDYGGLLKAYQLTNKFESFKKLGKQSGFLYYVNAWNTSKIDPTTGFVNLYNFKYENIEKTKEIISKFDRIEFNEKEGYFEFDIDYSKFGNRAKESKTKWTLCSVGERIVNFRNKEKQNNWDEQIVNVSDKFKQVFDKANIDILSTNLREEILKINSKELLEEFLKTIKVMTQLRSSSINNNIDYIQSPVKNKYGEFYNSEVVKKEAEENNVKAKLPIDADANGAYNIARKGLMLVEKIKNTPEDKMKGIKLVIKNEEWLQYTQK